MNPLSGSYLFFLPARKIVLLSCVSADIILVSELRKSNQRKEKFK